MRRKVLLAGAAAAVAITGGAIAALVLLPGGSGGNPDSSGNPGTTGTYTASAAWRLKIGDHIRLSVNNGCSITLTDADGNQIVQEDSLYGDSVFQIHQTGSFNWRVNDSECTVVPLAGTGTVKLPFPFNQFGAGETSAFAAPGGVAVHVTDFYGDRYCEFVLHDVTDGRSLDFKRAKPGNGNDTVTLSPGRSRRVYLRLTNCAVEVSHAR